MRGEDVEFDVRLRTQLIELNKNKIKKTKENNGVRTFHSRIVINFIGFTMKLIEQTCTLKCFPL